MRTIKVFDSTLRDGEQAPGYSMNLKEKISIARQLELLGIDVIEAGFAVSSPGDFASIKAISEEIKDSSVASLSRAVIKDIEYSWNAVKSAKNPHLHIFIATSDIHMQYKLKMTKEEVLARVAESVKFARNLCGTVQFSAEDATRSDREFLRNVFQTALDNGATVINMADTVGYTTPQEMSSLVRYMKENLTSNNAFDISVHCHNDLGLAVANSLAAISAGADRVEGTINGIGERAGNAAIEEIVMNLYTRKDFYNACTRIDTTRISTVSKRLAMITGVPIPPNKPIVGGNMFAHESGIHQHGVLQNRQTYEIITPESIGLKDNKMILGKHSGRHAFEEKLISMGYLTLTKEQIDSMFTAFKSLTDVKHTVNEKDIEALVRSSVSNVPEMYSLDKYVINSGNVLSNTCNIRLKHKGETFVDGFATGGGPIDAAFNAINDALKLDITLIDYRIESVTGGADAQGAVSVKIKHNGKLYKGYGVNINIFEASIYAYLNAINNIFYDTNL